MGIKSGDSAVTTKIMWNEQQQKNSTNCAYKHKQRKYAQGYRQVYFVIVVASCRLFLFTRCAYVQQCEHIYEYVGKKILFKRIFKVYAPEHKTIFAFNQITSNDLLAKVNKQ